MLTRRPGSPAVLPAAVLAIGTLTVAPAAPGQEPDAGAEPTYLRLSPQPEVTLTYAHRTHARVDAPPQLGGGQSLKSSTRLRQTPVRIGADSLDLRIEVDDISLSADSVPDEQLPDLDRHEGTSYLARMTTRGELVRISEDEGTGPERRAAGISPVQRSARMSAFPTLPDRPVRPGDTWVDTTVVRTGVMQGMGDGATTAIARTTLEEVRREGEIRVARLSVVTSYSFRPADSVRSGIEADMSGSGAATVRFDVTNGRYLHSESVQDYTVNLRYPDASRTYSVRFHVEGEARLVGVGDEEAEGGAGRSGATAR